MNKIKITESIKLIASLDKLSNQCVFIYHYILNYQLSIFFIWLRNNKSAEYFQQKNKNSPAKDLKSIDKKTTEIRWFSYN